MSVPSSLPMACLPSYFKVCTASRAVPSKAAAAATATSALPCLVHCGHGFRTQGRPHVPHFSSSTQSICCQQREQIQRPIFRQPTHAGGKIRSRPRSTRVGGGYGGTGSLMTTASGSQPKDLQGPIEARAGVDQRTAQTSVPRPLAHAGQEIDGTREGRDLDIRLPVLTVRVCIAPRTCEQAVFLRIRQRALVVAREGIARVEDFEDVDLGRDQIESPALQPATPYLVEGMRDVGESALGVNPAHRLERLEARRYPLAQKEPNNLARGGLDLLPGNDHERCLLGQLGRAAKLVVVCNGNTVETGSLHRLDNPVILVTTVLGAEGVGMEIDFHL